jgi:hypothetical protein
MIIGSITIALSTLFWLSQSNPDLEPSFLAAKESSSDFMANFTGFSNFGNGTHLLKSFERSYVDFLPFLTLQSNVKIGILDYLVKIVGGALTFGFLIIALRRRFERKYTR